MGAIFKRELRSYFTGAIGYVFLVIYLMAGGAVFSFTTLFSMSADVSNFFICMLIFSAVALPLLTMKSFSEERKIKTEQLILTAPVSLISMVFAKFFAAFVMFAAAMAVTSLYFLFLIPYATVKLGLLFGNLLALLLVGTVFISIGLFLTRSPWTLMSVYLHEISHVWLAQKEDYLKIKKLQREFRERFSECELCERMSPIELYAEILTVMFLRSLYNRVQKPCHKKKAGSLLAERERRVELLLSAISKLKCE